MFPTIEATWVAVAILVPVAAAAFARTHAIDLAYQLRAGEIMFQAGAVLDRDTFTFTAGGDPWLNQQWGSQVVLASIFALGGWLGLAVLRAALNGLIVGFLYAAMRRSGVPPRLAAPFTVVGWLVGLEIVTMLRPQTFGIALFAAVLFVVAGRHARPSLLWTVPACVAAWANLHGSFPLAFVLLAVAWLDDRSERPAEARRLLVVAGIAAVASMGNPFGIRVWGYIWSLSTDVGLSGRIAEWGPPSLHTFSGAAFILTLIGTLLMFGWLRRLATKGELAAIGAFAVVGFLAIRGVVWWGLVAAIVAANAMTRLRDPALLRRAERSAAHGVVVVALVILVALGLIARSGTDPRTGGPSLLSYAPQRLVEAAERGGTHGTRAFVSQVYGSWVEFSAPGFSVAVDSRIELFSEEDWSSYFAISDGRADWEHLLDRWDVDVLILHPGQAQGLLSVIAGSRRWRRVADGSDGAVYVRGTTLPST
jgi:hypothetical protein